MASPSSSSAAKPQPLHNFELPPLLKWNSKDGKSGGNPKRCRSMKSPPHRPHSLSLSPLSRSPPRDSSPAPRFEPPLLDFAAGPPRFQTHLMRESRAPLPPPAAAEEERKGSSIDDEFERMSLLQEENLRHYRGRDWWSESEKSDVIAYRRNPMKRSGFSPAKLGSSSNPDCRRSDAAGDFDVYRRNPLKKSPFGSSPARYSWFSNSDDGRSKSPADAFNGNHFRKPTFTFNSEENNSKNPLKKYAFPSPKKHSFSSSNSNSAADANPKTPLKKTGFSSPKKQPPFSNSEEKKPNSAQTDACLKISLKKSGFSSPNKNFSSNAEDKKKSVDDAVVKEGDANPKNHFKNQIKLSIISEDKDKKSNLAESDAASPKRKPNSPLEEKRVEKKPKEGEGDASPKIPPLKKSAFFGKLDKSKAAAAAAAAAAKLNTDSKKGKEEKKKEKETDNDDEDFDEEIKVWNLRPRNVKSKAEKPKSGGGGSSKSKAQPQLRSGAAKPPAGKSGGGGGEKKEKKKPLSIAISLTKQEIEEDIFALTGAKPSRRPKKRPKNVQKQLDSVFPGLYLVSITPESYKVSENSLKG